MLKAPYTAFCYARITVPQHTRPPAFPGQNRKNISLIWCSFPKGGLSQSLLLIKHPTNKTHIETSRKLRKIWRAKYDNSFATRWWVIHLKYCLSIGISRYMIEYLLPDSEVIISAQTHW